MLGNHFYSWSYLESNSIFFRIKKAETQPVSLIHFQRGCLFTEMVCEIKFKARVVREFISLSKSGMLEEKLGQDSFNRQTVCLWCLNSCLLFPMQTIYWKIEGLQYHTLWHKHLTTSYTVTQTSHYIIHCNTAILLHHTLWHRHLTTSYTMPCDTDIYNNTTELQTAYSTTHCAIDILFIM